MNKLIAIFIFLFLPIVFSCEKETFPDNEDIKGNWAEITSLMDQESLYFDGMETLFYAKRPSRFIESDTLIYKLDKKHEKLYLSHIDSPGFSESVHKIIMNTESNELTIWGLHYTDSEAKFKKQ